MSDKLPSRLADHPTVRKARGAARTARREDALPGARSYISLVVRMNRDNPDLNASRKTSRADSGT